MTHPEHKENQPDTEAPASAEYRAPETADLPAEYGRYMIVGFWLLLLFIGYLAANKWLYNANPSTRMHDGALSVQLVGDSHGHYFANGQINGHPVRFMLDTGASFTSIPKSVADKLGLKSGLPYWVSTANGKIKVYSTKLERIGISELVQYDISAAINPYQDDDVVLLGMNWLRRYELLQSANSLTISTQPNPYLK